MKMIFSCLVALTFCFACQPKTAPKENVKDEYTFIQEEAYELYKPHEKAAATLLLFGGFSETAERVQEEFQILDIAKANQLNLLIWNWNQQLWLEDAQKESLTLKLTQIFEKHALENEKLYLGGYSSGGNMALLLSDYLVEQQASLQPKGVFVVDSPIDLYALYKSSEKNIARNFSEPSVQESTWLIKSLGEAFGSPDDSLANYEEQAVYTEKSQNMENVKHLKNVKIRLYTEPDSLWWKENRMADADQMNAYYLERLAKQLQAENFKKVEFITTQNKGYRANGMRHPHSWSIVDKADLMRWILEE
tara:strand:+ start:422 stop:1339 length:918 start_codon:yes stop_codon:yes gene_type:complete